MHTVIETHVQVLENGELIFHVISRSLKLSRVFLYNAYGNMGKPYFLFLL